MPSSTVDRLQGPPQDRRQGQPSPGPTGRAPSSGRALNANDRPWTLADAIALLAEGPRVPLAGGTDLYTSTAARSFSGAILDLTALPDLRGINRREGYLASAPA
jgi:hypothetical protein